jgi:pyruvate,orthophosphate dikinase
MSVLQAAMQHAREPEAQISDFVAECGSTRLDAVTTGDADPVIDVLFEAQGEDVVSGRARPKTETELAQSSPAIAAELRRDLVKLERGFKDVQDVEFTIEDGRLWILQSRSAKRTPRAALKLAVDFVQEGLIAPQEALRRLNQLDLDRLAITRFAGSATPLSRGIGAAGGVATRRAAFDTASAESARPQASR